MFDVIGGDIQKRSAGVIRAGGTLVTIAGPPEARPADGLAIDFVVLPDRAQLGEIVQRVRDGGLRTNIGNVAPLDDAVAAFNPTDRDATALAGAHRDPLDDLRVLGPVLSAVAVDLRGAWPAVAGFEHELAGGERQPDQEREGRVGGGVGATSNRMGSGIGAVMMPAARGG